MLQIRYHRHDICVFAISQKPILERNDFYLAHFFQLMDGDNHSYLSRKLGGKNTTHITIHHYESLCVIIKYQMHGYVYMHHVEYHGVS